MATALAVAFVVYSCKGKLAEAESINIEETPMQVVDDMFIVHTKNGKIQMRAQAPLMEKYQKDSAHPNALCYTEVLEPTVLPVINKVLKTKHNYIATVDATKK